jgi:NAD(P)-dependent dehydrogenase (short-subunit alcohol dehydrogenase family)
VAQRYIPKLIKLANADPSAIPSLIVTSSMLPYHPIPFIFALSLVKAAQRNLMQSLEQTYSSQGVHIGLINVGGQVSPDDKVYNPPNIAAKAWEWFSQLKEKPSFEVLI